MAFDGSGVFLPLPAPIYPAVPGAVIYASKFNAVIDAIHTGLSNCITRDGQSPPLADLPMAGRKFTGVGDAADAGEFVSLRQLANNSSLNAGAGVVGFNPALDYPAGSVGAAIRSFNNSGTLPINNARIILYKRAPADTPPSRPSLDVTFTFSTGGITGLTNGWSMLWPAGTDPVWATGAAAAAEALTDVITPGEWAEPVLAAANGSAGANGLSQATIFLFQRTTAEIPPNPPSVVTSYNFGTGVLSGVDNNWEQNLPPAGGQYCWWIKAVAISASATDTIAAAEWGAVQLLVKDGVNGAIGPQGESGLPGQNGSSEYFHIVYAESPDGTIGFNQLSGTYVGTRVDNVQADSVNPSDYHWQLFRGSQGPQGTQGIAGPVGADGQTPYMHLKYSNDGGVTFTGNSGEDPGEWLGLYWDYTSADSALPSDYTWSKLKGDQGPQGFTGPQGPQGLQGVPGPIGSSMYMHVAYADSPDGQVNFNQSSGTYIGLYTDQNPADSTSYGSYVWRLFRGAQGPQGTQGIAGSPGNDGLTPYLHLKYWNDGGASFTANSGEDTGSWLGIYWDYSPADSTSTSAYTWSRTKGEDGRRGSVEISSAIPGAAWTDAAAIAAVAAAGFAPAQIMDRVTLYNSALGFAQLRFFDGLSWVIPGKIFDGNLLVNGSVGADAVAANAIRAIHIEVDSLTGNKFVANSVTTRELALEAGTANIVQPLITLTVPANNENWLSDILSPGVSINKEIPYSTIEVSIVGVLKIRSLASLAFVQNRTLAVVIEATLFPGDGASGGYASLGSTQSSSVVLMKSSREFWIPITHKFLWKPNSSIIGVQTLQIQVIAQSLLDGLPIGFSLSSSPSPDLDDSVMVVRCALQEIKF